MTNNIPTQSVCPLGDETVFASIKGGYGNLTVCLIALYEKGYVPGELFSRKQLIACGLGIDLIKTMLNQCEGREYDKRKSPKRKKIEKGKKLSRLKEMELDNIIESLSSPKSSKLYSSTSNWSQNLSLIKFESDNTDSKIIRTSPPDSSAVKGLFSKVHYANSAESLDLSPFKAKHGRGPASRLFVIPSPDKYANLFKVTKPDKNQFHYQVSGHKRVKSFCDAMHRAWMEDNLNGEENRHSMIELCNIQGDSKKTLRERNKRTDIKVKHNFFSNTLTQMELSGLLIRSRGGCWLELELPSSKLQEFAGFQQPVRVAPRYPVNEAGLALAHKEWKNAGTSNSFLAHLRIGGFGVNSYFINSPPLIGNI